MKYGPQAGSNHRGEMSFGEIAQQLGISKEDVQKDFREGIRKLRTKTPHAVTLLHTIAADLDAERMCRSRRGR